MSLDLMMMVCLLICCIDRCAAVCTQSMKNELPTREPKLTLLGLERTGSALQAPTHRIPQNNRER
jgi:hypothetical protein